MYPKSVQRLMDKYYPGYKPRFQIFSDLVNSYTHPDHYVLDAGGGYHCPLKKGQCREITAVDISEGILHNTDVDVPIRGNLEKLPLPEKKFDIIICRDVLEHLENPMSCFREFSRVLKDSGLCFITAPNTLHYATIATKYTPEWLHKRFAEKMWGQEYDIFPTFYSANQPNRLIKMMQKAGLDIYATYMFEGIPFYLAFSPATFLAGIVYERFVTRFQRFSIFRHYIIAVFKKNNSITASV
jgi:ubiquinone/menaquinone biosynthesis C-methylase UbiE